MPMPRRFVVVSAVGLADCVGIGGPLYNHVLAMYLSNSVYKYTHVTSSLGFRLCQWV